MGPGNYPTEANLHLQTLPALSKGCRAGEESIDAAGGVGGQLSFLRIESLSTDFRMKTRL
jgi:hypothetical protein